MSDAMDWIAITTGCYALGNAIAKASGALSSFVRDVRESRSELDVLSGELHSLDGLLDLLKDDAVSFPPNLATRTPKVLQHCTAVVNELEGYLAILNSPGLSKQAKRLRWVATKSHMSRIRLTLDGYKSTLGLALDLVAFTGAESRSDTGSNSSTDPDSRNSLSQTVAEMGRLSSRLQGELQKSATLRCYLDALQAHAHEVGLDLDGDHARSSSSISDAPDSAIEINDNPFFKDTSVTGTTPDKMPADEIDELLDELKEMPASPPVPPRNSRRSVAINNASFLAVPIDVTRRPTTSQSDYQFVTMISSSGAAQTELPPAKRGFMSRMFTGRKRSNSLSGIPAISGAISGAPSVAPSIRTVDSRPSTPSVTSDKASDLARRGSVSRRLSTSIKNFPMFKEEAVAIETEPNAVFGVSLAKSIQVAHGSAKTRHSNNGKGNGTSHRDFPLCVYKCTQFIGRVAGANAPEIFGEAGDPRRLAALRALFSAGPTYGEDVDWEWFTVYEAADLVLLFLSELPKPLVAESVAKRWIALSRQATVNGGFRGEQCIDFWEEALLGVRGPARNLLKLLLNLWADIAEAADLNGMTAERLAARVLQPLMHTTARTYTTDYMLGLAFLIRKRSEYLAMLQGNKGKSKAAF